MTKDEFLQAFMIRCAPIPNCHPVASLAFALEHWEALESFSGRPSSELRAMLKAIEDASKSAAGMTGPNDPRVS